MNIGDNQQEDSSDLLAYNVDGVKRLSTRRTVLSLISSCLAVGVLMYSITVSSLKPIYFFASKITEEEFRQNLILAITITYPLLAFFLGLMVGFLPYKRKKYWDKYLPFSLSILLIIYIVFIVLALITLIKDQDL